jgi:hypothetical protein
MHECQLIETRFGVICVSRGHKPKVSFIAVGMRPNE